VLATATEVPHRTSTRAVIKWATKLSVAKLIATLIIVRKEAEG